MTTTKKFVTNTSRRKKLQTNHESSTQLLSHLVEECHEYEHITDTEFLVHL